MSRQVFCRKYQKEMEGLEFAPFPAQKVRNYLTRFLNRHGRNGYSIRPPSLMKNV